MSLSSAEKCPDCGRWSYPGDPGCDCWADAMTEDEWMTARGFKRADAVEFPILAPRDMLAFWDLDGSDPRLVTLTLGCLTFWETPLGRGIGRFLNGERAKVTT